jgi:hypothetical protein
MRIKNKDCQNVTIRTNRGSWVIPHNCELLKALVTLQGIEANDLLFNSSSQCQTFIKNLLLLATKDEITHHEPSPLADLARDLIQINHAERATQVHPHS